jgi:cephalosporin hydroxylase
MYKVDEIKKFEKEKKMNIAALGVDKSIEEIALSFIEKTSKYKYSYNFTWLGRPIIQFPQDIMAMQEIIWSIKPDLIIETGIAHGGSLIFYASMLELLGGGQILGIDIDIREHNRIEIEKHPMFKRITMLEGSSIDDDIAKKVCDFAKDKKQILVALDSYHTHNHVLRELQLYSPLVTKGSYLVVFDTSIEDMPKGSFPDRPWDKGNNPKTAVWEFLKTNDRFEIDKEIENKLLITVAPDGYLKCIKD